MPPKYRYYFFKNYRSRGELSRLLFVAAGVDYEDIRVERYEPESEWKDLKPTMPGGTLPVLEVDGQLFGESVVIARYLAREFGLDGKNNYDKLLTDTIVDRIIQIRELFIRLMLEKDVEIRAVTEKKFLEEQLPAALNLIEKHAQENKCTGDFLVGDKLSWADLAVFDMMDHIVAVKPNALGNHPKIAAIFKLVPSLPGLSEYLKNRPMTSA
ncbi:hematopoietic prostaglandin D synthase [Patella vulgata]|uniref:hematopoietic prostaglandin D synthase n=1 Tax=Patella vulgata TaxID=6465 RepID=UPI00217F4547|nr:hematopoietic prostaglandin D synthase [Patella vulgata]